MYKFTDGILLNAYISPNWSASLAVPLIQIFKTTDTEWVIRTVHVFKSENNGTIAASNGNNVPIIIYYI